jgi:hypothetical protein
MTIQNSAMLCSLKMTKLGNTRKDKQATREMAASKGAQSSSVKVSKELLPDNPHLRDITRLDETIRETLRYYGLPWDAASWLLPTKHFVAFNAEVRALLGQREALVKSFTDNYPNAVAQAAAKLGTLYDANDYIHPDDAAEAFTADVSYAPIPTAGDFRIDMEAGAIAELESSYERSLQSKTAELKKEAWSRVHGVAAALVDRLTDDTTAATKTGAKIFRDTLVTNASELVGLLDGFNIDNDPALNAARETLMDTIQGITPEALRASAGLRASTANSAAHALAQASAEMDKFGW